MKKIKAFVKEIDFGWRTMRDFALIILGSLVQSLAIRYFFWCLPDWSAAALPVCRNSSTIFGGMAHRYDHSVG